jgi:hypothetical protein
MPCTMEYSIPRYSIAIAFVCRRLRRHGGVTGIEHGPAPSPGHGVETGAVPGRAMMRSPRTKRSDGWSCS